MTAAASPRAVDAPTSSGDPPREQPRQPADAPGVAA